MSRVWFDPARRELVCDPRGVGVDSEGALVTRAKLRSVSEATTLAATDEVLVADTASDAVIVQLPALSKGLKFTVKNIGAGPVYVLADGSDTIEGSARVSLFEKGETVELVGDTVNSQWQTRGWRVGRYALGRYGIVSARAFTAAAVGDVVTLAAHGYLSGDAVVVDTVSGGGPLAAGTVYYVRDVTTDTFKLAATSGGAAINITADGTGTVVSAAENLAAMAQALSDAAVVGARVEVPVTPNGIRFAPATAVLRSAMGGLVTFKNGLATTVATVDSGGLGVVVNEDLSGWPTRGIFLAQPQTPTSQHAEYIAYTGINKAGAVGTHYFTGITRAQQGSTARVHSANQKIWDALVPVVDSSTLPESGAVRFGAATRVSGARGSGSVWATFASVTGFANGDVCVVDGDLSERREVIAFSGLTGSQFTLTRAQEASTAGRLDASALIVNGEEVCYSAKITTADGDALLVARYGAFSTHPRPGEATRGYRGTRVAAQLSGATVTASHLFVLPDHVALEGPIAQSSGSVGAWLKGDSVTDVFHVPPEGGGVDSPTFRRLRFDTMRNFVWGSNALTFPVTDDLFLTGSSCGDVFNLQGQNEKVDHRGRVVASGFRYGVNVDNVPTGTTTTNGYIDKSRFDRLHLSSCRSGMRLCFKYLSTVITDLVSNSMREHGLVLDNGGAAVEIGNLNMESNQQLGKRNRTTLSGAIAASSTGPFPVVNAVAHAPSGDTLAVAIDSADVMSGASDGSADVTLLTALSQWPGFGSFVVTDGVNVEVFHYGQITGSNKILRRVIRARCGTTARSWAIGATVRLIYSDSTHPDQADAITVQGAGAAGADLATTLATLDTVAAVSTSVVTANMTFADATGTATTAPEITNAQFDDVRFLGITSAGASRMMFHGGHFGVEGTGIYMRYAVHAAAVFDLHFGHPNIVGRPVYDPSRLVSWDGGTINLRRPYNPDTQYAASVGGQHVIAATLPLPTGATPAVTGGDLFTTGNTGATTVTNLTGGVNGQVIRIVGNDGGLTTFQDNANLKLPGNITLADDDTLVFTYRGKLGYWIGHVAPANSQTQRTYTITNGTTDRTFDADATTVDEVADVLSTFIGDVKAAFPGVFG